MKFTLILLSVLVICTASVHTLTLRTYQDFDCFATYDTVSITPGTCTPVEGGYIKVCNSVTNEAQTILINIFQLQQATITIDLLITSNYYTTSDCSGTPQKTCLGMTSKHIYLHFLIFFPTVLYDTCSSSCVPDYTSKYFA